MIPPLSDDVVEDRRGDRHRRGGDRAIAVVVVTGVDARGRQRKRKEKKKTYNFKLGTLAWVRVVPSSGDLHRCLMMRLRIEVGIDIGAGVIGPSPPLLSLGLTL